MPFAELFVLSFSTLSVVAFRAFAYFRTTSRRLCEVGDSTVRRLDCHRRFSYPPQFGLSLHPPISQNRLLCDGIILHRLRFCVSFRVFASGSGRFLPALFHFRLRTHVSKLPELQPN